MTKFLCLILIVLHIAACVSVKVEGKNQPTVPSKEKAATLVKLGMKYVKHGNRDLARNRFVRALALDKKSLGAHHGIAIVHQQNGEIEFAEKSFKKAIALKTQSPKADLYYSYGLFLSELGRHKEACEQFAIAGHDLDYKHRADAIFEEGKCSLKMGNKLRAKSAFQHAVNLKKDLSQAHLEIADLYFSTKDFAASKRHFDQFEALTKHNARSLWLGIRIERVFGNRDKASSYGLLLKNKFG